MNSTNLSSLQLQGFVRNDGRIGFRNHALVMPLTGCLQAIAQRIADQVPGATCFAHPNGCDLQGEDGKLMAGILERTATHPNVGGVLFLAMGCSAMLPFKHPAAVKNSGRLVQTLNTQQAGGTSKVIAAGCDIVRAMVGELSRQARAPVPFSGLVVGTKCGASDANSFSHCHPVVGKACDRLVEKGATVVLSEDCELVAGAGALARRAVNADIAAKIRAMARTVNRQWKKRFGTTLREFVVNHGSTPADWRKQSLAHALKAGSTPITGFFDMAENVKGPGLVILNAPNTDLEAVTCLAASGCNVTLFTTGRGTPVGSPTSITLKLTATRETWTTMEENIDLCVADVARGVETQDQAADRIVRAVVDHANGRPTKAETLRHWEVALPIRGVTF